MGKDFSETVFNLVASRLPIDLAVEIASKYVSTDLVSYETLDKLKEIQKQGDEQDKERIELELAQKEADLEATQQQIELAETETNLENKVSSPSNKRHKGETEEEKNTRGRSPAEKQREKAKADKKEKGYSKLEQRLHEKTRVGATKRSEKLQRSEGSKV